VSVLTLVDKLLVDCLLLNVFQSVEDNAPVVVVFAVAIEMVGVVVPVATLIGAEPVTEVTVPPELVSVGVTQVPSPRKKVVAVAPDGNLATVTALLAISTVAMVPSDILAEVTALEAIIGAAAVPLKSPANWILPFANVVASGVALLVICVLT